MVIAPFSRRQVVLMKGVGILLIVLHNFFHNLTPWIGQNEFLFHPEAFYRFWNTIRSDPFELPRAFFSYFGHYGVQLFIFFSAYGLTRKYAGTVRIDLAEFLRSRIVKIHLSFLLCVAVYVMLGLWKEWLVPGESVLYWDSLLWKVLLLSPFIPGQALMPVGPWWFIPFIFQLYLLYPLLLLQFRRRGVAFLLLVSLLGVLAELALNGWLSAHDLNLNYTVFGHLPVICLGIYLAEKKELPAIGLLLSLLVFLAGNFSASAWVMMDVAVTALMLAAAALVFRSRLSWKPVGAVLLFYGGLSFHLFMVNGFLRSPFHQLAERYDTPWMDSLAALSSLLFSTLAALALSALDSWLRGRAARLAGRF